MLLASDRRYGFAAGVEELWCAFGATHAYRRWWPWLREHDATALVAGDHWRCVVRSPLPFTLRFTVSIEEVVEHERVRAHLDGDIRGDAALELRDLTDGVEVRLTSRLSPARPVFSVLATIARPLVVRAHDRILDTGARQFAQRALGRDVL